MGKTLVFSFGRMSPPTNGHEKLVQAVEKAARTERGDAAIYVSHSFDKKKNPLTYDVKLGFLQKAFGSIVKKSAARTALEVAADNDDKYSNLVMVVGSDRVPEFEKILKKYNGDLFNFDSIKVVSAGERDPDADDVSGMSASKMRGFASKGDFDSFKHGLPKKLIPNAKEVYDMTREGMGLTEGLEEDEVLIEEEMEEGAVVSLQQRRARGLKMRALKNRLKAARERAKHKMASTDKLKGRAERQARAAMRAKMSGGRSYGQMGAGQKIALDKRLARIPAAVLKRLAMRKLPQVRRAEVSRLSNLHNAPSSAGSSLTMQKYNNHNHKTESVFEAWDSFFAGLSLQELSKATLKSYLVKAGADERSHRAAASVHANHSAHDKLQHTPAGNERAKTHADKALGHYQAAAKRQRGISKALGKSK